MLDVGVRSAVTWARIVAPGGHWNAVQAQQSHCALEFSLRSAVNPQGLFRHGQK